MGQQSFSYLFQAGSQQISLVVGVETPAVSTDGGVGYPVQTIGGFIGNTPITGESGTGGSYQYDSNYNEIDNTIYPTATSSDDAQGIDYYGLSFTAGGDLYNLYALSQNLYLADETKDPNFQHRTLLNIIATNAPCFLTGTLVRSSSGDRSVETLAIGDLVLTADGTARLVKWMGHRTIDPVATHFANPDAVMPVRIRAGALGHGLPVRDLLLSPDHAVLVEGVLVQAGALVNGTTVVRETRTEPFTYWHVELENHELILAEGVPAETFVSSATRMGFDNWAEHQAIYGDGTERAEMDIPRVQSVRQLPQRVRHFLAERVKVAVEQAELAHPIAA